MMKYQIKIKYRTGDSEGYEDAVDTLELEWENLDIAKENLQAIREHYTMYCDAELSLYYSKIGETQQSIIESNKDKWWFVEQYPKQCIKFKADNNNIMQMSAFWTGYFETLYCAEIVTSESDLIFIP